MNKAMSEAFRHNEIEGMRKNVTCFLEAYETTDVNC